MNQRPLLFALTFAVLSAVGFADTPAKATRIALARSSDNPATSPHLYAIRQYRPFNIETACVINAVLFEDWFKQQFPGAWYQRVEFVEDRREPNKRHEVVAFEMDGRIFAWDWRYNAMEVTDARKDDITTLQQSVGTTYRATRRQKDRRDYADIGPGSINYRLYEALRQEHSAAIISYNGTEFLVFMSDRVDGEREMVLFNEQDSSRRATFPPNRNPEKVLKQVLAGFFDGNGSYTKVAGDISLPPLTRSNQVVAQH